MATNVYTGKEVPAPTEEEYQRAKLQTALSFAPPIHACKDCQWPVVRGYCCNYCGSVDP